MQDDIRKKHIFSVTVSGNSMAPLYCDGEVIQVDAKAYQDTAVEVGDIVFVEHPYKEKYFLVKKVVAVGSNTVFIEGVNSEESTDSRHFGSILQSRIKGKVLP